MERPILSDNEMWEAFGGRVVSRIVYGGADLGECRAAVAAVGAGGVDAWYGAWMALAERLDAAGEASAAKGHAVSAREAYLRATAYYQAAYLPLFGKPVDHRLLAAFDKETAAFHKAASLFDPPVEIIEIPFEGTTLPGYFVKVDGSGRPSSGRSGWSSPRRKAPAATARPMPAPSTTSGPSTGSMRRWRRTEAPAAHGPLTLGPRRRRRRASPGARRASRAGPRSRTPCGSRRDRPRSAGSARRQAP
jgi:hypothetical protein